jgi:PAS domain S-box-containing protein
VKAGQVGYYEWNIRTGSLACNDAALEAAGLERGTFRGRAAEWFAIVHPDDAAEFRDRMEEAVNDRNESVVEYRVRRPDNGSTGWIESRSRTVFDEDGQPLRAVGMLWDVTQTRLTRDSIGRSLQHMSDAFFACDTDWRITYVNIEAERILGPALSLLGHVLWEAAPDNITSGLEDPFRRAMAGTTPIDFEERLQPTGPWYRIRVVPVPNGLLVFLADINEDRIQRAEHTRAEQAAAERSARVAELMGALAKAVTARDVVHTVAERVLPPFDASGLIIQTLEGGRLQAVGCTGYPPPFLKIISDFQLSEDTPVREILLHHPVPMFFPSPEELIQGYPGCAEYAAVGGKKSWAFLPLIVSGRVIGFCCVTWSQRLHLSDNERTVLAALSGLIAQAIERARLYDTEHTRAQELQRGMLPRALPSMLAVTATARFLPTSGEVGGDWYDVIPLSSGRVALVIGDVMGHGLSEAVTMGRLRTAVYTLAALGLPPDELLARLNDLVNGLGDDFCATCLYAVYDPVSGTCTFACAGHPPPAIVSPDGTAHFPELALDPPLGAATPPFETTELSLPEDGLLVLYTDGLIESRTRDIGDGMTDLAKILTTATDRLPHERDHNQAAKRLDSLCDTLTSALLPTQQTYDDAALLIARIHRIPPQDIASWPLPEDTIAAAQARRHTREQLAAWDLDDLVMTSELLVSELVGNVVRHAKGPVQLRLLRSDVLVCEVSDGSLTTPHICRASATDEGGRGLQLVEALSHRWGTRYTPTGKCIWTEQLLPLPLQPTYTAGGSSNLMGVRR